jgi:hypothetical protein
MTDDLVHPGLKTVVQCIVVNVEDHIGAVYVGQFSPPADLEGAVRVLRRVDPDIARVELWRGVQRTEYVQTNDKWEKAR